MKCFHYEKIPVQHAIYGPSAPIAPKLTADNWQQVAILRAKQYVYIGIGRWGGADEAERYRVDVSPDHARSNDFATLEEAVDYANALGKPDKERPFKSTSNTYAGIKFGNIRQGVQIPINKEWRHG